MYNIRKATIPSPVPKIMFKICTFHLVICADGQNLNIPTRTAYLRSMKLSGAPSLVATYESRAFDFQFT